MGTGGFSPLMMILTVCSSLLCVMTLIFFVVRGDTVRGDTCNLADFGFLSVPLFHKPVTVGAQS